MQSAKQAARQIIEHLPEQAGWDQIMYQLDVQQKIEAGLADVRAGHTVSHKEVKTELLGDNEDSVCWRSCWYSSFRDSWSRRAISRSCSPK